jgi:hypothetical protein
LAAQRRRQDPAAGEQLRAVDRVRQRRHRALGGQDPAGTLRQASFDLANPNDVLAVEPVR